MYLNIEDISRTELYSSLGSIYILVIGLLIASIATIFSKKIELSVFSMITTFALSGLIFILIGIPFFGLIYLLVYTAAISILFLFVIMMLRIKTDDKPITYPLPLILLFCSGVILWINYPLSGEKTWWSEISFTLPVTSEWSICTLDTMQGLAYILYTEQVSLLILITLILLIIMVGLINHLNTLPSNKD